MNCPTRLQPWGIPRKATGSWVSDPTGSAARERCWWTKSASCCFFADGRNARVLVWDIDPARMQTGADAIAVLGQPDFYSNEPATGSGGLTGPGGLAYHPQRQNLFVMDRNRVMVFDVSDRSLDQVSGLEAFAVIGQPDFDTNEPSEDLRKISNGPISPGS